MGKKDNMIRNLEALLDDQKDRMKAVKTEYERVNTVLKKENLKLTDTSKQLIDQNEQIRKQMTTQLEQFQVKFQEIQDHRQLMILTINVTGTNDITETLNEAVTIVKKRLEDLGMKDKFNILAVPHTMSIGIR